MPKLDVVDYDDAQWEDIDTEYLALGDERLDMYLSRWRTIAETVAVEDGLTCTL